MKFDVQKNITIDAPLSKVRELIENFNHWNSWSPWTVLEPGCSLSVVGNPAEPGHSMSWEGQLIGAGQNTFRSAEGNQLHYDLEFFKPWKSKAKVRFLFEETNNQTQVTWKMDSSMPFFMFFMIKTMKNLIGMDYERGLRMLKEVAEKGNVNADTDNNGIVDYHGFSYVGIQRTLPFSDMPTMMEKDFERLVDDIVVKGQKGAEHWVCIYPKFDMKTMEVSYIAALSDEELDGFEFGSDYVRGTINDSRALEIKHRGSYEFLGNAWSMGMMIMQSDKKLKGKDYPFEQYWNSPLEEVPENLETSIYFPLKS